MNKKKISSILLSSVMLMSSASCGKKEMPKEVETTSAVNVEVYTAGVDDVSNRVTYTGEIKAAESVSVSAKVSAKAVSVNVKEGDYVKAGQVLATLDKTDLQLSYNQALASYNSAQASYNMTKNSTNERNSSQAQQSVNSAQIAYENALNNYNRELELYNQNSAVVLAEQSRDDAVAAYNRAKELYDNDTNLISARNAYQTALDNYNRSQQLYEQGAISKNDLDTAKNNTENAKASLDTVEANNKASMDSAHSAMITAEENLKKAKTTAKASLDSAKTALDNAKNSLDSANENISLTSVSNSESLKTSEASVESALASLNIAKNNLNNTSITAPISGYISTKNVNMGQMVSPGVELFSIKNSNTVDGEINVTESVISNVSVGTKAIVSVKSADISDVEGAVTQVNPVKDERTGMYIVKVTMENADNALKVGMFADITLITHSVDGAITIPTEAVMQSGDEKYVYIANGNQAEKAVVITGIEDGDYIQIVSGIEPGDKIIVSGKDYLSDKNSEIKIVSEYTE
ncbi:MAG: efflux RND transporter periplasmic adaptor subunit [Clostridia bacterium]|nr:efflux RND transporter periplasmic adaptor subunit [Clostridia bacterium]